MAKRVFMGLVTAWRLAGRPTSLSSSSVKATIEGVVLAPSAFSSTLGLEPSITATHELVVPRSMPMTLAISSILSFAADRPGPMSAHGIPEIPNDLQERSPRAALGMPAYIGGAGIACNGRRPSLRPAGLSRLLIGVERTRMGGRP